MQENNRRALPALVVGDVAIKDVDGLLAERLFGHGFHSGDFSHHAS
jgi:hypothetical protein